MEIGAEGINVFGRGLGCPEDIPNDSAAALLLIEHHWAVGLRDAIARARLPHAEASSALDLVKIGLLSAEEAKDCT
jgi:hypothetical protein